MIALAQCKTFISDCEKLGTSPAISIRRATAVMAICNALAALSQHVAHYDAVVKEEEEGGQFAASSSVA